MPHDVHKLLIDIRTACEEIIQFTEGQSLDDFKKNRILKLALERQFEIIGEAIFRLDRVDHENLAIKNSFKSELLFDQQHLPGLY